MVQFGQQEECSDSSPNATQHYVCTFPPFELLLYAACNVHTILMPTLFYWFLQSYLTQLLYFCIYLLTNSLI